MLYRKRVHSGNATDNPTSAASSRTKKTINIRRKTKTIQARVSRIDVILATAVH